MQYLEGKMSDRYVVKYTIERYHQDVIELTCLVGEYGIKQITPNLEDKNDVHNFLIEVHNGWKIAQKKIKDISLEIYEEIKSIELKIKGNSKNGSIDKKHHKNCIKILFYRLKSLLKMIDAIIWTIFCRKEHKLRRLYSGKDQLHLNRKNIEELFLVIDEINSHDSQVAIAFDLSTFAHIGDYVHLNLDDGSCNIVELKSGERNLKILSAMENLATHGCLRKFFSDAEVKSEKDTEQVKRIIRQKERALNFMNIIKNDEGEDYSTGMNIRLSKEEIEVESYTSKIEQMFSQLNEQKTWTISTIDACLFLGMYHKDCVMPPHGIFSKWMELIGVKSEVVDYRSVFMVNMCYPPLAHFIPLEFTQKIYLEEVFFLMCLDCSLLIKCAKEIGINMYLGEKKESRRLISQQKNAHFVKVNGRVIHLETKNGIMTLSDGVLTKIYYSFLSPLSLMASFSQNMHDINHVTSNTQN